jgi:hypothetical protein
VLEADDTSTRIRAELPEIAVDRTFRVPFTQGEVIAE